MLANGFRECQCESECVRVGFLNPPRQDHSFEAHRKCAFGLFPEISTPVEKTVEIPQDLREC